MASTTVNDALWDEIRCRQRGAEEKGCGSSNGRVRHGAVGRGGCRSSRQGAGANQPTCLLCKSFKKQLDAASSPTRELSHVPPCWVRIARVSRKGALRRQGERDGSGRACLAVRVYFKITRSSSDIYLSFQFPPQ